MIETVLLLLIIAVALAMTFAMGYLRGRHDVELMHRKLNSIPARVTPAYGVQDEDKSIPASPDAAPPVASPKGRS